MLKHVFLSLFQIAFISVFAQNNANTELDTIMQTDKFNFMENIAQKPVILFDGICNLCNDTVQFIINRDKNAKFMFASLQSDFGQQLLEKHQLNKKDFDSIILLENSIIYRKSTAAIKMFGGLDGVWKLFYVLFIFPAFIRNFVYDFIARNRYRFFGKKDACMIPTPELKTRFLK